jgi:hypothetical protein
MISTIVIIPAVNPVKHKTVIIMRVDKFLGEEKGSLLVFTYNKPGIRNPITTEQKPPSIEI